MGCLAGDPPWPSGRMRSELISPGPTQALPISGQHCESLAPREIGTNQLVFARPGCTRRIGAKPMQCEQFASREPARGCGARHGAGVVSRGGSRNIRRRRTRDAERPIAHGRKATCLRHPDCTLAATPLSASCNSSLAHVAKNVHGAMGAHAGGGVSVSPLDGKRVLVPFVSRYIRIVSLRRQGRPVHKWSRSGDSRGDLIPLLRLHHDSLRYGAHVRPAWWTHAGACVPVWGPHATTLARVVLTGQCRTGKQERVERAQSKRKTKITINCSTPRSTRSAPQRLTTEGPRGGGGEAATPA